MTVDFDADGCGERVQDVCFTALRNGAERI